jgi:hypothetical protein
MRTALLMLAYAAALVGTAFLLIVFWIRPEPERAGGQLLMLAVVYVLIAGPSVDHWSSKGRWRDPADPSASPPQPPPPGKR